MNLSFGLSYSEGHVTLVRYAPAGVQTVLACSPEPKAAYGRGYFHLHEKLCGCCVEVWFWPDGPGQLVMSYSAAHEGQK
jgi:hypothetical protein